MQVKAKLYLVDEEAEKYMGAGVLWLLEKIQSEGSLRKASQVLQISYSKCYNMIANLEKHLDREILDRKKGGSNHIGSSLTPFAIEFASLYREYQTEAKEAIKEPFSKFENKLEELLKK